MAAKPLCFKLNKVTFHFSFLDEAYNFSFQKLHSLTLNRSNTLFLKTSKKNLKKHIEIIISHQHCHSEKIWSTQTVIISSDKKYTQESTCVSLLQNKAAMMRSGRSTTSLFWSKCMKIAAYRTVREDFLSTQHKISTAAHQMRFSSFEGIVQEVKNVFCSVLHIQTCKTPFCPELLHNAADNPQFTSSTFQQEIVDDNIWFVKQLKYDLKDILMLRFTVLLAGYVCFFSSRCLLEEIG